jgi:hypothetical protein
MALVAFAYLMLLAWACLMLSDPITGAGCIIVALFVIIGKIYNEHTNSQKYWTD